MRIWTCNIYIEEDETPMGFDSVPRDAAIKAIESEGIAVESCSSGWGYSPSIELKKENQRLQATNKELLEALEIFVVNDSIRADYPMTCEIAEDAITNAKQREK